MVLFYLFAAIQCMYALYFFIRVLRLPAGKQLPTKKRRPVSIIICAKNEAENLEKNLPSVLSQKYEDDSGKPLYEVIVVNDASDDDTAQVLADLEKQYDNLWDVIIAPDAIRDLHGKKFALSKGLAFASHDWVLLTDADCSPQSDAWLEKMVAPLADGKQIVAGYGGYYRQSSLLNAFTRWETVHTFLQCSTYALAGLPYMAVGRNMACTKEVLLSVQGSEVWNALPSGDDDLLVSIAGNADNVAIVCDEAAFTHSEAKKTWSDWAKQKRRHLSTGKYYKSKVKALLGGYGISHAGMWLCFLGILFLHFYSPALVPSMMPAVIVIGVRCILYWVLWLATATKLKEKLPVYLYPLFDLGWLVYNFAFLPYITWKNKKHWK